MDNAQKYFGKVVSVNEGGKFVEAIILHFGVANENRWVAMEGSLDAFLARIAKAKKYIPACYQHDEENLIGQWREFEVSNGTLKAKLFLDDIPFVRDVVIPQLKSGTLQGASPTIAPIKDMWNDKNGIWEIVEGALCEVSLVGIPADLRADILTVQASIKAQQKQSDDFDIEILSY
jgi:HK97 family phage prohead protease